MGNLWRKLDLASNSADKPLKLFSHPLHTTRIANASQNIGHKYRMSWSWFPQRKILDNRCTPSVVKFHIKNNGTQLVLSVQLSFAM